MTSPGEKTMKKKKRRTAKGSKDYYVRGKPKKGSCALCGGMLHGVPHGKRKAELGALSKTQKRPSVPFGGVLCGKCRKLVAEERAKIKAGAKGISDIGLETKRFVEARAGESK